jgi:hypothetical protein
MKKLRSDSNFTFKLIRIAVSSLALFMVLIHTFIPHHHLEAQSTEHTCMENNDNSSFLHKLIIAFEQGETNDHLDKVSSSNSGIQVFVKLLFTAVPELIYIFDLQEEKLNQEFFYTFSCCTNEQATYSALRGPPLG